MLLLTNCKSTHSAYVGQWRQSAIQDVVSENPPVHTLYLIGDVGAAPTQATNRVLDELELVLKDAPENSSLVFLGDQVYPRGLPKKKDADRAAAEAQLTAQLAIVKDFSGDTYFIPGERDWMNGKAGGHKAVQRQERFVEAFYENKKVRLYPGKGCADPKVIKIHKDLVFVFLDSQWWLHDWKDEAEINEGCDIKSRYDLTNRIQEIFFEHKNDEIVWLMHHPPQSNGIHGGNFSWRHHIFPFSAERNLPIPLPVLGSIGPILRGVGSNPQDIAHQQYQELMEAIQAEAIRTGARTIFASAHDQGLQYFDDYKLQYIISGSGGTTKYTDKGGDATFVHQARGFAKVLFYEEFEAWLEFYAVRESSAAPELVFRTQIRERRPGTLEDEVEYPPLTEAHTTLPANANFAAGKFKQFWWGEQYRDEWTTPVKARNINLSTELGGLTPIKKGGGMSSNSLRMQAKDGKQYILRSINKDYRKLVPPAFKNLKLIDVFQDQNSASHPYAALTLPTLSRAAGVYYTAPQLVYLKHQPGLGNYNAQFPEEHYLLEQRPSGNWSDTEQFGFSEEIIGYADLLVNLREKKAQYVDQEWVCKSRMFDVLIHDWDRHDDQWRWATFQYPDSTVYRPIPRDRDQALYKFKGLIPQYIAAFPIPKFKTMKGDLKDAKNQSHNARWFDRYFLNGLEWSAWETIIRQMQADVTDAVIDEAMAQFPPEIIGEETAQIGQFLKERRDKLVQIGRRLYDFLSKEVEVSATDEDDRFEIFSHEDGSLSVDLYVLRQHKGDVHRYSRRFYPNETREVRLYGLRGKDEFVFGGSSRGSIRVRIVGGEDDDVLNNEVGYRVLAYDEPEGITLNGQGIKERTSATDLEVNEYNRYGFRYNTSLFLLNLGYTVDDGIWLGGAASWTKYGWRKQPYKYKQSLSATVAPGSREAFQIRYQGHFPDLIGQLDFAPEVDVHFPRYENFFGLGNDSKNRLIERRFNWVRLQSVEASPLLQLSTRNDKIQFHFGPMYESIDIKNTEGRVSDDADLGFTAADFDRRHYLGGQARFMAQAVDNNVMPTNGFRHTIGFKYLKETELDEEVITFQTQAQLYLKLTHSPLLVLAQNLGYQKVWGDPLFHQYADLGNRSNLRGFRNERFRGNSAFYHNIDLRLRLIRSKNNILPIDIGLLGGFDYGRVWLEGESSNTWYNSQTVGLWLDVLGLAVLQPYYSFNQEENLFNFRMGFNF
ncbi:MAG: ShlB/FhaC/HecB family hemolysin secretion/activation protein [Bacteroidota bacterium]